MDRSTIITLVGVTYVQDAIKQYVPTETRRDVYADVRSISRTEWFDAGRNGLNPSLAFHMFEPDYHGEDIVEYNGKRYGVYRTYRALNETIELYCEEKSGLITGGENVNQSNY